MHPARPVPHKAMKIILPDKSSREMRPGTMTVEELLRDLGFDPFDVIVSRNGTLVTEDAIVANDDEIRIIRIAHGG
ncbi:MAG: thiamine biosynthesis protein ThiS [Methanoregula sp.]|nr:MAG: thiamine biosynthesis protein ThiS [Methanoregula sp.]